MEALDVDEEVAVILVQEGFTTVEELAYVPESELLAVEEFDEAIVGELRSRARDLLLTRAIVSEGSGAPAEDLLALEGMTTELATTLAANGIADREELAEQAVDDLLEITGMDEESAGKLIMAARAHWFEEEEA
jgi:N utilization substance protein A